MSTQALEQSLDSYSRDCPNGSNAVTTTPYRSGLTVADSYDLSAPLGGAVTLVKAGDRTTVYVRGDFANASDTCVVMIVFYAQAGGSTGAYVSFAKLTLTADANARPNGTLYGSASIPADCVAENYEVRLYTAGAGAVSLFTWVE